MAKVAFTFDDRVLRARLQGLDQKIDQAVRFTVEYHAMSGMQFMKQNAPWTDRTGAARSGLFSYTEYSPGQYTITFSHSVHYGIWLEVKYSGRDQIIMPTVIKTGNDLMNALDGIMGKL